MTLFSVSNSGEFRRAPSSAQVRGLVETLRDIVTVLGAADPEEKAELYRELGVNLTYHPEDRVSVEMHPRGVNVRVGGGT